jgi:hypothetical protein
MDALVLDENKGPFLPYKSDHVRSFWMHLVYMAYSMIPQSFCGSQTVGVMIIV